MTKKTETTKTLRPIGIHILVQPLPADNAWAPIGKAKERPEKGIVIAIGEGVESEALKNAIDKIVVYRKYSEEEYTLNGQKYYLVEEADIMGVWE